MRNAEYGTKLAIRPSFRVPHFLPTLWLQKIVALLAVLIFSETGSRASSAFDDDHF
jgi:hypothetical protein